MGVVIKSAPENTINIPFRRSPQKHIYTLTKWAWSPGQVQIPGKKWAWPFPGIPRSNPKVKPRICKISLYPYVLYYKRPFSVLEFHLASTHGLCDEHVQILEQVQNRVFSTRAFLTFASVSSHVSLSSTRNPLKRRLFRRLL